MAAAWNTPGAAADSGCSPGAHRWAGPGTCGCWLRSRGYAGPTLGEFLASGDFSWYFRTHFARPLVSAVWSCAPLRAYSYPARYLCAFLANHGMLAAARASPWKTVVGGSRSYVERISGELSAVLTGTPIRSVHRLAEGGEAVDGTGHKHRFDAWCWRRIRIRRSRY